jgi:hypothetical protein
MWSGMVLLFDGLIGYQFLHQFESRNYSSTTARITHSEVIRRTGSKGGTVYEPDIRYHYEVNGQVFDSTRLRYGTESISSSVNWATRLVNEHPVGLETQIYFNPKNPADSLLLPGLDGSDIFGILFLMPFNMIALVFWTSLGGLIRERLFRPVAGGVKIISEEVQTRIRLPQYSAFLWGAIGAGGMSFVSIFIVGFCSDLHPSLWLAGGFLFLAIAGGTGAYVWRWRKIRSGEDDLIINEASGTIELPKTYGRRQRRTVNASDIAGITVEVIKRRSSKGGVSFAYAPTLLLREAHKQKIADWNDKMKAEAFSTWLREKLGVKTLDLQD